MIKFFRPAGRPEHIMYAGCTECGRIATLQEDYGPHKSWTSSVSVKELSKLETHVCSPHGLDSWFKELLNTEDRWVSIPDPRTGKINWSLPAFVVTRLF